MLQGAAFELDIVEFLIDEARKAGHGDLFSFIDVVAKRGPDSYNLPALLDALGNADHPAAPDDDSGDFRAGALAGHTIVHGRDSCARPVRLRLSQLSAPATQVIFGVGSIVALSRNLENSGIAARTR